MVYTCAITALRPNCFKFKYKENHTGCKRLKRRLEEEFKHLYQQGVRHFFVGGALGVDMWAGEILLRLKEKSEYGDLKLQLVLPCDGHDKDWDERARRRMAFLRKHSLEPIIVGTGFTTVNYRKRNEYLVDHADVLIAVFDTDLSIHDGAQLMIDYARTKKIPIVLINPDNGTVTRS